MRITCFADTHRKHGAIKTSIFEDTDVAVFAGDMGCESIFHKPFRQFHSWMERLPSRYKVAIPGNHDEWIEACERQAKEEFTCGHLLIDEEVVIEGVKFYGSPWQPEFCNWAYNLPRGERLQRVWAAIPDDTEVLITHGPPMGIMDWSIYDKIHVGCEDLKNRIAELKHLKVHVFGHIHHGYGNEIIDGIHYINASICTERYEPENFPITIEI